MNPSERNHQVSLMRHIFGQAACVKICLVIGGDLSAKAFILERDIAKAAQADQLEKLFSNLRESVNSPHFSTTLHTMLKMYPGYPRNQRCQRSRSPIWNRYDAMEESPGLKYNCVQSRCNPHIDTFTTNMYEGPRGLVIPEWFGLPTLFEALEWYCTKE